MKHATVPIDGMQIPLIGIPQYATLETCDLCHDEFHLSQIMFNGVQFLCPKCRSNNKTKTKQ